MIPQLIDKFSQKYVSICGEVKSQGQFRYEIKITVISLSLIRNYNEITLHLMNTIKDYIINKS